MKRRLFRDALTKAPVFKTVCRRVRRMAARAAAGKKITRVPAFELSPEFPVGLRLWVTHCFNEVLKRERLEIATQSEKQGDGGTRIYFIPLPHCGHLTPEELAQLHLPDDQWEVCE